jgi:uncharacterized protein YjbI with pentapeptide repeats
MKAQYIVRTGGVKYLLLAIPVAILVIFTINFLMIKYEDILLLQQQIEYLGKIFINTVIVITCIAVIINAYYTAKISRSIGSGGLAKLLLGNFINEQKGIEIETGYQDSISNKLILEHFNSAIEQLGNEKTETRLGAIYSLEAIVKKAPNYHWTIMEILAAFIRENSPNGEIEVIEETNDNDDDEIILLSKIPTDIQAALTIIGRRNTVFDSEKQIIELKDTDLRCADLNRANLQKVDFSGSNLSYVMMSGANLEKADFTGADLTGAILYQANLKEAVLYETNLQKAILRKANLSEAMLYQANLQAAMLYDANFAGAMLYEANLQGAILCDANFEEVNLEQANLFGANLIGVNLQQAVLIGANLESATLSTANLVLANLYEANLHKANLIQADLKKANLTGANFKDALLQQVDLIGADLQRVENLSAEQITDAIGDSTTILPDYLELPSNWE